MTPNVIPSVVNSIANPNVVTAWLGQLGALKTSLGGAALAASAAIAFVIKRIGKPTIVTARCGPKDLPQGLCANLFARVKKIIGAIDYLATRREWRYGQPWMLMLGEQGAGKTSLVGSVSLTWRHSPPQRASELTAPGTQWAFFRHGVLIDAEGKLASAAEGSDEAEQWKKTLAALNALRPERPLDGILLCVSARSLREASTAQRERLAENLSKQLSQLQEEIEFVLPVYVVVTQCDSVTGFGAFWQSQPAARRGEMFGYSAMAQDQSLPPSAWAHTAFDLLGERLRALQVDVAAHNKHVEDVDNFFLFPGHFAALREPLGQWLETVFKATAWQSGYLFRGIYFTGAIDADGITALAPRTDVSFVDALVSEKALREPHLARPTRPGVWSRNRLIRAMQITGLAVFACLFVALLIASINFSRQVGTLVSAMNSLDKAIPTDTGENGCLTQQSVYPLLKDVALIDTHTTYLAVPASWIDGRVASKSAERIGHTTVGRVLMPALACHLEVHARHLMAAVSDISPAEGTDLSSRRAALQKLVSDVRNFEDNLDRFNTLATKGDSMGEKAVLSMLAELATYSFGAPTPPEMQRPGGILDDAFDHVKYDKKPVLPNGMRARLARQIEQESTALHQTLDREVSMGDDLLDSLAKGQPPVLENTRKFANWLSWARQSWLTSSPERNPCAEIVASIKPDILALVTQYDYGKSLNSMLAQFDSTQCYKPEMTALAGLRLSPYGPMFEPTTGGLDLSPALQGELAGLPSLVSLGFMRLQNTRNFACDGNDAIWRSNEVAEAAGYLREYETFAKQQKLPLLPAGGRPLYDKLARMSLERALDDAMYRAQQIPQTSIQLVSLEPVNTIDEQLAETGNELAHGLPSLQNVLKAYADYGFSSSGASVRQCVSDFAADNLGRVSALASASRLYAPQAATSGNAMFDIGNLPVLKDYLSRQVSRAQILAGYASPFLSVLQTGTSLNDAQRESGQTASYWSNTTAELNRYAQAKDPSGQVSALDNYFIKQLSGLTYANCNKVLAAYSPPEPGIDMFSERRSQLEQLVAMRCTDRKQAQALEAYRALAERFNRDLAGRYPFGDISARDASPAIVKAFFMDYDAQRDALQDALADVPEQSWKERLNFVAQLDAASAFFRSNLDSGEVSEPVKLTANFRALPKSSPGSDQIVSWLLTAGMSSAGFPNRATTLNWSYGQPLVLDLTWADRSQWSPHADAAQGDLIVDGKMASFAAMGSWSLLRMIDAHRPVEPTHDPLNAKQILLEFKVSTSGPNAADGKPQNGLARLYLGLTLAGTDPKTQAAVALKLPQSFPHSAPEQ
ncbi:MAG TPA: type VI secretion system protein [Rhodocyclaceae bacterium]|nr:type VI secretion system protein [Rhodocyclaceae bacterium]